MRRRSTPEHDVQSSSRCGISHDAALHLADPAACVTARSAGHARRHRKQANIGRRPTRPPSNVGKLRTSSASSSSRAKIVPSLRRSAQSEVGDRESHRVCSGRTWVGVLSLPFSPETRRFCEDATTQAYSSLACADLARELRGSKNEQGCQRSRRSIEPEAASRRTRAMQ